MACGNVGFRGRCVSSEVARVRTLIVVGRFREFKTGDVWQTVVVVGGRTTYVCDCREVRGGKARWNYVCFGRVCGCGLYLSMTKGVPRR